MEWIAKYISLRQKSVALNDCSFGYVPLTSVIPPRVNCGPVLFLLNINAITLGLKALFKMFANDCVLYRNIADERYFKYRQHDSNLLISLCADSEKPLNVENCVNVTFTRKPSDQLNTYTVN